MEHPSNADLHGSASPSMLSVVHRIFPFKGNLCCAPLTCPTKFSKEAVVKWTSNCVYPAWGNVTATECPHQVRGLYDFTRYGEKLGAG